MGYVRAFCLGMGLLVASGLSAGYSYWAPHLEGDGRIGGFRHGGGVIGWAPLKHREGEVVFTQVGGGYYLDQYVATFGIGYRALVLPCLGWGVNGFADFSRSTRFGKAYAQGGIGAELFGNCWDARINAYFPTNNQTFLGLQQRDSIAIMDNGQIDLANFFSRRIAQAYLGGDIEVGGRFCVWQGELRGYLGYYAYNRSGVKVVQGPRVRVEYRREARFMPELSVRIGGEWQTDRLHSNDVSLLLGVVYDRGKGRTPCCSTSACDYLGERVYRQMAPWVLSSLERRRQVDIQEVLLLFVAQGGTGFGTQSDPTSIDTVESLAGPGDVIILLNDNGPINVTSTFMLEADQQLGGFLNNPSIQVTLSNGQTVTIPNLNMSGPAVLEDAGNTVDLLQLAEGTSVFNFETSGGMDAITGTNVSGIQIDNVTINNPAGDGIVLTGGSGFMIDSVLVDGAQVASLSLNGVNGGAVTGSTFQNGAIQGFLFSDLTGMISFTGSTLSPAAGADAVTSTGGNAIVNLVGLTITGTGGNAGIDIRDTTGGTYLFGPLSLTNYTSNSILLVDNSSSFIFNNTIINSNNTATAIEITNQMGGVTFSAGTINQTAGGQTVLVSGGSGVLDFSGLSMVSDLAAMSPISVMGMTGGAATFMNGSFTNVSAAMGINLSNNAADLILDNVDVSGSLANTAVLSSGNTGTFTYQNGTIINTAVDGIRVLNPGTATSVVTGNTFGNGGGGIAGNAVEFRVDGATTTTAVLTNNNEIGSAAALLPAYFFLQEAGGTMNITVSGNSGVRTTAGAGIHFLNNGSMPGLTLSGVDAANTMATPATTAGANPIPP